MEPYHAVVYFAPGVKSAFEDLGLSGFWRGYFASRGGADGAGSRRGRDRERLQLPSRHGPLGDVGDVGVAPTRPPSPPPVSISPIGRCGPGSATTPSIRRTWSRLSELARRAAEAASSLGRPLFAGYTALEWPEVPHLLLWHAATLLREHRGDGHVNVLVGEQVDGCEANVLSAVSGASTSELQRASRRWPDDEWEAAADRLRRARMGR